MAKQLELLVRAETIGPGILVRVPLAYDKFVFTCPFSDFAVVCEDLKQRRIVITALDVKKERGEYVLHCHAPRL